MTATTETSSALKNRMQRVLRYAIEGARTGCAGNCSDEECIEAEADRGTLQAADRAIDRAATEGQATAIYLECWTALTGIPAEEWNVQVIPDGGK